MLARSLPRSNAVNRPLNSTSVRSSVSLSNVQRRMKHQASNHKEVVIVSAVRTPIGSIGGSLASVAATDLGALVVKSAVEKAGIRPGDVQAAYLGNVLQAGEGQAPARQAVIKGGLPNTVVCTTVNKVCASGMKSIMIGAQDIMLGHHDVVVAGGFESMSNTPFYLEKARYGYKYGHGKLIDGVLKDGLMDVYNDIHMGNCAEKCAANHKIGRKEQDDYAIQSYQRAAAAYTQGYFQRELISVPVPSGKKGEELLVKEDEEYKKVNIAKIPTLKPAFLPEQGTVTAANASKLNDGASAVVLMSADKAKELGLKPIARIVGFADAEHDPVEFPSAPAKAVPVALKRAGLTVKDIDYWELNEAFSVVGLVNAKLLHLDNAKLNVWGGGVSLGHPIGSSGSRIVVTLTNILHTLGGTYGCASICNGGGGASAIVIQKL